MPADAPVTVTHDAAADSYSETVQAFNTHFHGSDESTDVTAFPTHIGARILPCGGVTAATAAPLLSVHCEWEGHAAFGPGRVALERARQQIAQHPAGGVIVYLRGKGGAELKAGAGCPTAIAGKSGTSTLSVLQHAAVAQITRCMLGTVQTVVGGKGIDSASCPGSETAGPVRAVWADREATGTGLCSAALLAECGVDVQDA